MEKDRKVYIKLQEHLDSQAVGFPATKTGAEIRILEHIFTPKEAEIATNLSYKFEPLNKIFSRAKNLAESPEELKSILDQIVKKGGIEVKTKTGEAYYCNAPLVVGMYEFQNERLTPEFIENFNKYTNNKTFGVEFLSTELPQMRTIPVSKSIKPEHKVSTFDEIKSLLKQSEEPFNILECICRKKKSIEGEICKVTERKETCLGMGSMAKMFISNGLGREITREEAISIIEQNQKEGLVLQPSNTKNVEFICSCCGCCCGMLTFHKSIPKPVGYWATNFYAVVDKGSCEACGTCEKMCQADAITVPGDKQPSNVNLDRCLGCGVCVSNCPTESISLMKKPTEAIPPQTREELHDILMDKKKGKLGKLMVTGKLLYDAVTTGQTHLLK
jgi:Pyruvate/2-oxoacid:ferredoxin oxidoreductase delta subunit